MRRRVVTVVVGGMLLALVSVGTPLEAQVPFVRGDANGDGGVDISDAISLLNTLFGGQPGGDCDDAADTNNDGGKDISDPISILNFLFGGGPQPPAPYPDCGLDGDEDGLDCMSYPECTADCLSVAEAEALIESSIPTMFCVDPDSAGEIPVGDLRVSVCPVANAQDCDAGEGPAPGCPIVLSEVDPAVDLEAQQLVVGIAGSTDDFPVAITDTFGNTVVCTVDMMFSADVLVTFDATKADNVMTINSFLFVPESLDDAEIEFTAAGGFVCNLLQLAEETVATELREQLKPLVEDLIAELNMDFGGTEVCCE